jgi:hypothetical protein
MLHQAPWQVASAVDSPFSPECFFIVTIEDQIFLDRPLDQINSKVSQEWRRESRRVAKVRHIRELGQSRANRA